MRTLLAILALANLLSTGCGFAARHPVQTKVYIIGAGMLVGGAVAISQRRGTCTITYPSGYVYFGTAPCPGYK